MKAYQEPVAVRTEDGWPATIHWRKLTYLVADVRHACGLDTPQVTAIFSRREPR